MMGEDKLWILRDAGLHKGLSLGHVETVVTCRPNDL